MRWLTAALEWQSWAVVGRHLRIYVDGWHIKVLPPAVEPVTMLLAFGLGLGSFVDVIEWRGRTVPYMSFVAPGMLAYAAFMTAFFQALYAAFIRMHFQRTWEGQLTTQIEMRHVVWGEILWAALLATSYVAIVGTVLTLFRAVGLVSFTLAPLPLVLPVAFVAACGFAALGLLFTALAPTIDHLNLPVFLFAIPLAFVSATYFPLRHPVLVAIASVNPLYHLAEGVRALLLGGPAAAHLAAVMGLTAALLAVLVPLDMRLLARRVLGE